MNDDWAWETKLGRSPDRLRADHRSAREECRYWGDVPEGLRAVCAVLLDPLASLDRSPP